MAAKIIDGKKLAELVIADLKRTVELGIAKAARPPKLVVIRAGENAASDVYVSAKVKRGAEIGVVVEVRHLSGSVTRDGLLNEFRRHEDLADVDGIIVQQPLPMNLDVNSVLGIARPEKDVDGAAFSSIAARLSHSRSFAPCTPAGVLMLIDWVYSGMQGLPPAQDLSGRHAVVIGRSGIVGRPAAEMLLARNASVTVLHSKSALPQLLAAQADIVVAACGVPALVTEEWIKPGAIVIDVGISRKDKLLGDVDFASVNKKAGYLTPVPGGVGPMTVAMLLKNTVTSWTARCR